MYHPALVLGHDGFPANPPRLPRGTSYRQLEWRALLDRAHPKSIIVTLPQRLAAVMAEEPPTRSLYVLNMSDVVHDVDGALLVCPRSHLTRAVALACLMADDCSVVQHMYGRVDTTMLHCLIGTLLGYNEDHIWAFALLQHLHNLFGQLWETRHDTIKAFLRPMLPDMRAAFQASHVLAMRRLASYMRTERFRAIVARGRESARLLAPHSTMP